MLKTVLYDQHIQLNAKMIPFGPWEMPVQYEGIVVEHKRTRHAVTMFDTCHMGEILVEGPNALAFLESLVPRNLNSSRDGRCYYTQLCQDDGGILDDVIIYRFSQNSFMLVVNGLTIQTDWDWIKNLAPADVRVDNQRGNWFKIDLQGPEALTVITQCLGDDCGVQDLAYFAFKAVEYNNERLLVSRTGYTGELGYEVYGPCALAKDLWKTLLDLNVMPAGLGARDTLRLEMGYPLMGQDMDTMVNPRSVGFEHFVSQEKNFVGVAAIWDQDPKWISLPFVINQGGIARHNAEVKDGPNVVGLVTSGTWSPTLQKAIGLARVPWSMRDAKQLMIQIRQKKVVVDVVALPFVRSTSIKQNTLKQRSETHVS